MTTVLSTDLPLPHSFEKHEPVRPVRATSHPTDESRTRSVIALVREALACADQGRRLRWTDQLADLGLTSLRLIGLAIALEEQFGLDARALASVRAHCTIGALAQICLRTETAFNDPYTIH